MIQTSRILGELAKSAQGNAEPEGGDSKVRVPGLGLVTLNVPRPAVKHFGAISATPEVDSFKFSEEAQYNVTGTQPLCAIGPGLWEVNWTLSQRISGAISDLTSTLALLFAINDGTGANVIVAKIHNGQTIAQSFKGSMILTVPSPISFEFRRERLGGAGTGLNFGLITIHANKRL